MMRFLKIAVLSLGVLFASCSGKEESKDIPVSGVSLDKMSMSLTVGETAVLTATVTPAEATNKKLVWATNNPLAATVDGGRITALAAGTAIISATAEDGGAKASCTVTVKTIPVESVSLDKTSIALESGGSVTLVATVLPENATNKGITWKSADPGVATVVDGKVTVVSTGNTTITVTTEDGGLTASCTVKTIVPIGSAAYLTGEWKLSMWNDTPDLAGKVYVRLNADKSFTMYQNLNQAGHTRYTGTFQYDTAQNLLSGTYSDGVAWKRSYKTGKVDENQMKWFDKNDASDVSAYVREAIPDYVKSSAAAAPASTRAEERFL